MNRQMARKPLLEIDGRPVYDDDLNVTPLGFVVGLVLVLLLIVGVTALEGLIG